RPGREPAASCSRSGATPCCGGTTRSTPRAAAWARPTPASCWASPCSRAWAAPSSSAPTRWPPRRRQSSPPWPACSAAARPLARRAAALVLRATGGLEGLPPVGARHVTGLVAAVGLIGCTVPALLSERAAGDALEEEQDATVLGRLTVVVALLAVLAAGVEGW